MRNPPAVPADTTAAIWHRQMAAIARRSIPQRLEEWRSLNDAMAQMEADAVRRRHPGYSDREVFLALVRRRYGDELALAVWPDAATIDP